MARRGLVGQLNMFDLYNSQDVGEVEMVSLVPDFEEKPEPVVEETVEPIAEPVVEEEPEMVEEPQEFLDDKNVAMSRVYTVNGVKIEIAYINYNKVRITRGDEAPIVKEFVSSKEAVDYYVEQMQEFEADE